MVVSIPMVPVTLVMFPNGLNVAVFETTVGLTEALPRVIVRTLPLKLIDVWFAPPFPPNDAVAVTNVVLDRPNEPSVRPAAPQVADARVTESFAAPPSATATVKSFCA